MPSRFLSRMRLPRTVDGQVLLCSLVSALALFPHLSKTGLNGISRTYAVAAQRFWSGTNPYDFPVPHTDWFKYSPSFALFYGALAYLPEMLHALLWGALNFTVYWLGVARWVPAYQGSRWLWFWLIAASMELDGAVRYQQVNALLTGLVLWAVADYRDGKAGQSGSVLAVATNFKVLPAPFLIGLSRERRKHFWIGILTVSAFLFLLPCFFIGWSKNLEWHRAWFNILRKDAVGGGLLDLESVLSLYVPGSIAHWTRLSVGALTFVLLWDPRRKPWIAPASSLWLCIGLTGILLFNPRTEPPTFVFAAPVLPLLWLASESLRGAERYVFRIALFLCFVFLSLIHNDIWPRALLNARPWHNIDKTFAVWGLWLLSLYLGVRRVRCNRPS